LQHTLRHLRPDGAFRQKYAADGSGFHKQPSFAKGAMSFASQKFESVLPIAPEQLFITFSALNSRRTSPVRRFPYQHDEKSVSWSASHPG